MSDAMHTAPKHFRVKVWREDMLEAPPDTLDEDNETDGYWTPARLAASLRTRYGPTVHAEIEADGVRFILRDCQLVRAP